MLMKKVIVNSHTLMEMGGCYHETVISMENETMKINV